MLTVRKLIKNNKLLTGQMWANDGVVVETFVLST